MSFPYLLRLEHQTTKEQFSSRVEKVSRSVVTFRWGLAGSYEVHLKTGVIRHATKRGAQPVPWTCLDLDALRTCVAIDSEEWPPRTPRVAKCEPQGSLFAPEFKRAAS